MSNPFRSSYFPESQQDIARLKQMATDAASDDLSHSTGNHAAKAGEHSREMIGHTREGGSSPIGQLARQLDSLANSARNYAVRRPLTCLSVALGIGFLIGWSTRRTRDD